MATKDVSKGILLEEIERIREIMIDTALVKGLVNESTIKVGQVLDMMLNELEEIY